ncbi:hypothetical protein C8Q79DRAFT_759905 [Trametes meyenii]|nr:hypothetical protein C8Q79DRAFT_759905 [Trametes meyenii]
MHPIAHGQHVRRRTFAIFLVPEITASSAFTLRRAPVTSHDSIITSTYRARAVSLVDLTRFSSARARDSAHAHDVTVEVPPMCSSRLLQAASSGASPRVDSSSIKSSLSCSNLAALLRPRVILDGSIRYEHGSSRRRLVRTLLVRAVGAYTPRRHGPQPDQCQP